MSNFETITAPCWKISPPTLNCSQGKRVEREMRRRLYKSLNMINPELSAKKEGRSQFIKAWISEICIKPAKRFALSPPRGVWCDTADWESECGFKIFMQCEVKRQTKIWMFFTDIYHIPASYPVKHLIISAVSHSAFKANKSQWRSL